MPSGFWAKRLQPLHAAWSVTRRRRSPGMVWNPMSRKRKDALDTHSRQLVRGRALASTSFAETSHSDQSSLSRPWPAPVRHRQSEPRTLITAVQFLVRISNISPHEWASRGGADFQCDDASEVRYSRRATVSCIGLSMSARSVRRQGEFFPTAIEPVVADIKRPGPARSQSMLRPAPF
jgi:hypothetical protein